MGCGIFHQKSRHLDRVREIDPCLQQAAQDEGDRCRLQDLIHQPRFDRMAGHSHKLSRLFILGQHDTARGFDRADAPGAVGARARQDHRDGGLLQLTPKGLEKLVDGVEFARCRIPRGE